MSKREKHRDLGNHREGKEFSREVRGEVIARQGGICIGNCGRACTEVHHNKPIFYGGTNDSFNGVGVCSLCHTVLNVEAIQAGTTTEQVLSTRGVPFGKVYPPGRRGMYYLVPANDPSRPSLTPRGVVIRR